MVLPCVFVANCFCLFFYCLAFSRWNLDIVVIGLPTDVSLLFVQFSVFGLATWAVGSVFLFLLAFASFTFSTWRDPSESKLFAEGI